MIEALQALENAGLVGQRSFGGGGSTSSTYHATRLGEEAVAGGSVRELLTPVA